MKRIGDEIDGSGSQVKPPLGSPPNESCGQSPVPGNGDNRGGIIGDRGVNTQRLSTDDALTYLMEVKRTFQDQRDKYDMFLEVMNDFKEQRIHTSGLIARVKELLKGHNNLILGFNTFLPKGYEITLDNED
ncbi:hypothetical protein ARALYDRAFT_350640 [Arabidopsis lyrata subsp. lyrata]|uniref:Paired amphipathic helix repeat-containing protein n=1 Tax=Arabidopsis lyrata subsp. lyrata TaxID=81972 RepID=D7M6Q6_ARALL|nr:paired amphipathic helix protein Sin3-like 2 [Arabidopsis lyrata subsp. lyrata]XP_020878504.1 paired amphipathic helix protein Sin3-like 2 [Arabidopsis lyrata subsp. lyrata]EFH49961.1 hypothetical protein ARALYDRAFT_350640 [Arabidopsis lyrata subsp. lyrata]|eukprot:XP_002873702.1 paired amphipathic helix protein Sin3-like 2 [Arabidopsis lyrata subsp. lyrata]